VVVGVDDYARDTITDLKYACEDAKLLNQAMSQILHVPKDRVFLFTSDSPDPAHTPTVTNIVYRLDWLRKQCKPGDTVLLFFAGHGVTVDGESFLLTEESDNRTLETLKRSALNARDVSNLLRSSPAGRTLMVLDACRNDPGGKTPAGRALDPALYGAVSLAGANQENATLYSCNIGERSWEWDGKKHGYFSYYFYEGLREGAVGPDGAVTLQTLQDYLLRVVPKQTLAQAGTAQTPRLAYDGPSTQKWVLARSAPPAGLAKGPQGAAQLDAAQARQDVSQTRVAQLENKLQIEETRRKQAEARLEAVEKQLLTKGGGDDLQKLAMSRDLALQELLETRKQLEAAKAQLPGRGGNAEMELLNAEREHLKSENKLLQARINLLEGKLQQNGVSYSRAVFTVDAETPLPTGDPARDVDNLLTQSAALRQQLNGYTTTALQTLGKAVLELEQRLQQIDNLSNRTLDLQQARAKGLDNSLQQAQLRLRINELKGRTPAEQWGKIEAQLVAMQQSLDASEQENRMLRRDKDRLITELQALLSDERYRQIWVSRRFHEINRLPGMGDILDIPIKTGPEAQEL
jgi:hypothetical protein